MLIALGQDQLQHPAAHTGGVSIKDWIKLFQSHLCNRRQVVVIDGVKSDVLQLKAGIPQGSKLGPILFNFLH